MVSISYWEIYYLDRVWLFDQLEGYPFYRLILIPYLVIPYFHSDYQILDSVDFCHCIFPLQYIHLLVQTEIYDLLQDSRILSIITPLLLYIIKDIFDGVFLHPSIWWFQIVDASVYNRIGIYCSYRIIFVVAFSFLCHGKNCDWITSWYNHFSTNVFIQDFNIGLVNFYFFII